MEGCAGQWHDYMISKKGQVMPNQVVPDPQFVDISPVLNMGCA
jgi:hypothetical protein